MDSITAFGSPRKLGKFWLGLIIVLLINWAFKFVFTPSLDHMGVYSLINTPKWMDAIKQILTTDPFGIFLPQQYPDTDGKILWWTTTLVPFYYLNQIFSPFSVYIITSSLLIITVYCCSWFLLPSFTLSFTMAILFALGTQFHYVLTYGVLLTLYILLSYIAVTITLGIHILRGKNISYYHYLFFVLGLTFCALGSEYWINFAVALIVCLSFLILWSTHHGDLELKKRSISLIVMTAVLLLVYLLVERHASHIYFKPGVEEEVVFTYTNILLVIDDLIVNYFTLLYMTLSNYLPSFLFFSNSATYLGETRILAEQHGYHAAMTKLVLSSHLFEWRFYAGVLFTVFFYLGWKWFRSCWQSEKNIHSLILFLLWIAVGCGFCTHLIIKMRPYNTTPMLGYKVVFSVFAFTIMLAYLVSISREYFKNLKSWRMMLVSVWMLVFLSALTRPTAINAGLMATGLNGYSDPVAQVSCCIKKVKKRLSKHSWW